MSEKILVVDDDVDLLEVTAEILRAHGLSVDIAPGPFDALARARETSYAVVVSDMVMPGMDGIQMLAMLREHRPDTVRILITAVNDLASTIQAINRGHIFRFLTKPCQADTLVDAVTSGIAQHRLITTERELLEKTFSGTLAVLADIMAIVNPPAFGRADRIRRLAGDLCEILGKPAGWEVQAATALSQIGCVTVPEQVLAKVLRAETLATDEQRVFNEHPSVGAKLLGAIPRLEGVARAIQYQEKRYDGSGLPRDAVRGEDIPWAARLLKVVLDFDSLHASGLAAETVLAEMSSRADWYDPAILAALRTHLRGEVETPRELRRVGVRELEPGMTFAADVRTSVGLLLVARGYEVTSHVRTRLLNIEAKTGIATPLLVFAPRPASARGKA
jgi:response regulator RpfG family c-di-GMP phosphodiesterase